MISVALNSVFSQAVEFAKAKQHEYLTVEHIFWSILQSSDGEEILAALGADVGDLAARTVAHLEQNVPKLTEPGDPIETVALSHVINDMMNHIHAAGRREAMIGDMLAALSAQEGTHVVFWLESAGIERVDILEVISHPLHDESQPNDKEKEKSPHPYYC